MKNLARCISVLFHPAVLQGIYLFYPSETPLPQFRDILVLIHLLILFPLILSGIYLKSAGIKDMFTIPRENRTIPFLISIGGIVLSWFLFRESLPWIAERILIVGLLNGIALAITRFEKMSLHVYACVLVSVLWIPQFSGFTFILLPLIVWARLELKAHTWNQMIMGAAAGLILGCMIGYIGKNFEFNI